MMYQCTKLSATFNVTDKTNFEHKCESVYHDKYSKNDMVILVMIMKWYDYIGQTVNGILQTIMKGQKSSHFLQYTK